MVLKPGKYSAILSNLKDDGFFISEEVKVLMSGCISERIIVLDSISDGKEKPVPILGKKYEEWFKGI